MIGSDRYVTVSGKPVLGRKTKWGLIEGETKFQIYTYSTYYRLRTDPGKPGKSWNFIMAFSRTGKSWKKATGPGKVWKSVKHNLKKNMKCMEGSKEN